MVYSRCCQAAFLTRSCCQCHVDQVESEAAEATWPDLYHCESKPAQWCIAEWFDLLCCGPALVLTEDPAGLGSAPITENKMTSWTHYKIASVMKGFGVCTYHREQNDQLNSLQNSQCDERIFCLTCHSTLPLLVLPVFGILTMDEKCMKKQSGFRAFSN